MKKVTLSNEWRTQAKKQGAPSALPTSTERTGGTSATGSIKFQEWATPMHFKVTPSVGSFDSWQGPSRFSCCVDVRDFTMLSNQGLSSVEKEKADGGRGVLTQSQMPVVRTGVQAEGSNESDLPQETVSCQAIASGYVHRADRAPKQTRSRLRGRLPVGSHLIATRPNGTVLIET
jgi:hypothetical protein